MKARRYSQRVAWAANARSFGRRWRLTLQLIGGAVALVAFIALWPSMFFRQGEIGFVIGAVAGVLALSIARFDDPRVRGDLAEQWSAEAFGKVRGWRVINGLSFSDGDVDHIVVTPSGVLAAETKYRFGQPDLQRLIRQRHSDLAAATRAARKTAHVLSSKQVGYQVSVTPVLMIWGKDNGRPDLPDGFLLVDGVYVLDGYNPGLWHHLFNAPRLSQDTRVGIQEALARYQRRQADWAERNRRALRSICWSEFWAGVREERAEHHGNRAKRRALRRRHSRAVSAVVPAPIESAKLP